MVMQMTSDDLSTSYSSYEPAFFRTQTVSLTARLRLPSGTRCQGGSLLAHPNGVLLLATVNNCTLVQTDRSVYFIHCVWLIYCGI
jgi:hypothetical protein